MDKEKKIEQKIFFDRIFPHLHSSKNVISEIMVSVNHKYMPPSAFKGMVDVYKKNSINFQNRDLKILCKYTFSHNYIKHFLKKNLITTNLVMILRLFKKF